MAGDQETRALYAIGSHLGKSVSEVLDLSAEEIRGWVAYLAHLAESRN